jgi:deoxyribodipyrimidine photolyase-related protein
MEVSLVFPHQIYEFNPCIKTGRTVYLIEDHLYFTQLKFHKQKLVLHRASMRFYEDYLKKFGFDVVYVEYKDYDSLKSFFNFLSNNGVKKIHHVETVDYLLEKRITEYCRELNFVRELHLTPNFIAKHNDLSSLCEKDNYVMAEFYIKQRIKLDILVKNQKPVGGKWSFDSENRKKLDENLTIPDVNFPMRNLYVIEAITYIETNFKDNYGDTSEFNYPVTFKDAIEYLDDFLKNRLYNFGNFQDAIISDKVFLFHSLLSPVLNIGILSPEYVITRTLEFHQDYDYPLNSLEGFIRQIIGWREYIRAMYILEGNNIRTLNIRKYSKKIPKRFWEGNTGILPLDDSIKKALKYGYCHHIERLMVIGNFMLLCEFDPDEVYEWFMTMFVDSHDWVMVPNVYSMSQYADGGLISTKPYITGSNYIRKMSDYKEADWCEIWDALYWRFIAVNRDELAKNPRMNMVVSNLDSMEKSKLENHITIAENYLQKLK